MTEQRNNSNNSSVAKLTKTQGLFVVGIGASAGGLEAMREMLAKLDYNPRISYVIAQHLSPTHTSMLKNLLARECKLNVVELDKNQVPEANSIYITPPNTHVEIRGGQLRLYEVKSGIGPKPSIDRFFASLADDQGENAIGIILSGTGTDGASGLLSIKSAGGTTFVQDPATAKYDGMPQAAIQTGAADIVLPAGRIGGELAAFASAGGQLATQKINETDDVYTQIIGITRDVTGFNLALYKSSTIERRIKRRMALYHFHAMEEYLQCLRENDKEAVNFAQDVLISVTEFFRDPEAFEALESVINEIVAKASPQKTIRAWVAGCATGEEAYSMAILFEEAIRKLGKVRHYQIFATDIDTNATNRGRQGRYPATALDKIGADWRERYFHLTGDEYVATKTLRDRIVFSVHNLIQDPPFSRVDLISCRNLLIYFTSPLQKRVMELFHYASNPSGVLFLGKTETIGSHEDLYTPINKSRHIYCKVGDKRIYRPFSMPVELRGDMRGAFPISERREKPPADSLGVQVSKALQEAYGPPSVVISANDEVIHTSGEIAPFLGFHAGPAGLNVYDLINDHLRAELRALVYRCRRETIPVCGGRHTLAIRSVDTSIRMAVRGLTESNSDLLLICFESAAELPTASAFSGESAEGQNDSMILELEHELTTTREHLQTVVEELETSNEELQSVNEEMQSANEELQSMNEELQTSNEELQSTNEELLTVNDELQVKSRELESLAADLQNIQDSIDFPLIVVDTHLRVMRFVPATDQIIAVKEIHQGDAITSLAWRDDVPKLRQLINRVIKTGKAYQDTIHINQRIYQMHILPYVIKKGETAGALLLFPDTTELEMTKGRYRQSEERLKNLIDHVVDGVISIDEQGHILLFSKSAERIFGYQAAEVLGKNISMLMPEPDASEHDNYLKQFIQTGVAKAIGTQREVKGLDKNGRIFPLELSVDQMQDGDNRIFTGLLRDITLRKQLDEALYQEKERAQVTLHSIADGVITTDGEGHINYINRVAERLTGYTQDVALNKPLDTVFKIIDECTRKPKGNTARIVIDSEEVLKNNNATVLLSSNGKEHIIEHNAAPIRDSSSNVMGAVVVFRDVTEKSQMLRQMAWQARHDPLTGLINRKEMEVRLEHAITSAKSFHREHALLYIDLDQFKIVNDTCGHQAGDELLRQITGHFSANLRQRDALSRLGGDEFAVLLENCSIPQAQQIAEAVRDAVDEYRFVWEDKVFKVGASIGVVAITQDSTDLAQILSDADAACYAAKDAGRNRVQLHSADDVVLATQRREMHWAANINQVFDENRLTLYFQRIQPLMDDKSVHWEVLLRMTSSDGDIVLPNVFLPAVERYGRMQSIDHWVLRTTLVTLDSIPKQAHDQRPNVAINISGSSLGNDTFLEFVEQQFASFPVLPSQVCFEITETAAIANYAKAREFIKKMKKLGCRFALDDFGSGMSSFGYLKTLPVDYIKIDGSFVKNMNHDIVDLAMVESINRIGQLMEIETIAEFAETDEIINKLRQVGVNYAQGYGVQHPIQAAEFLMSI